MTARPSIGREQEAELAARNAAIRASRRHLEKLASERNLGPEIARIPQRASRSPRAAHSATIWTSGLRGHARGQRCCAMELIEAERNFLYELLRDGKITDESRRRLERDLDLEEAAILARREGMTPL